MAKMDRAANRPMQELSVAMTSPGNRMTARMAGDPPPMNDGMPTALSLLAIATSAASPYLAPHSTAPVCISPYRIWEPHDSGPLSAARRGADPSLVSIRATLLEMRLQAKDGRRTLRGKHCGQTRTCARFRGTPERSCLHHRKMSK